MEDAAIRQLLQLLSTIKYGEVTVTIKDGKIVRIDESKSFLTVHSQKK